jgi:hypothetical protein
MLSYAPAHRLITAPPQTVNARYGYGWVWDRGCYNPVTGTVTGGGGGAYVGRHRRHAARRRRAARRLASANAGASGGASVARRLQGAVFGLRPGVGLTPGGYAALVAARPVTAAVQLPARGSDSLILGSDYATSANGSVSFSSPSPAPSTSASGAALGGGAATAYRRTRVPNKVYTAAAGAVAATMRTQAPAGARVIVPPAAAEAAAARVDAARLTPPQAAAAAAAAAAAGGASWVRAAGASAATSGAEAAALRDLYAASAYFSPAYGSWGVELACRFKADWNVRNTVTLLATIVKTGVITHGSAPGEAAHPLGLAYPQVAARGGTMLVTYTYSSYANLQAGVPGAAATDVPAYAGACGGDRRGRGRAGAGFASAALHPTACPSLLAPKPLRRP